MSGSKNREGAGQPKAAGRSDRDREIERLTEVFKDAILHAPIPDVNPNLIRTVESQARECALRVVGGTLEAPAGQGFSVLSWVEEIGRQEASERLFFVDKWTGEPCPTMGNRLCTITDPSHLHRDGRPSTAAVL